MTLAEQTWNVNLERPSTPQLPLGLLRFWWRIYEEFAWRFFFLDTSRRAKAGMAARAAASAAARCAEQRVTSRACSSEVQSTAASTGARARCSNSIPSARPDSGDFFFSDNGGADYARLQMERHMRNQHLQTISEGHAMNEGRL